MVAISQQPPIKRSRWLEAQEYERGFWQRLGESIQDGSTAQLDWYRWRASRLEALLRRAGTETTGSGQILEIGSGPIGIINFLERGERFAVDPLEPFYRQQAALIALRNPGSTYLEGSGEHLPLGDGSCSLVIIDNVIDHTYAPEKILQEISRVLAPHGRLYLCVNVHTGWGAVLHDVLATLRIDKGHPYTFTSEALRNVLKRHRFRIELEEIEDSDQAGANDRRSTRWRDRVKGWTGLSEFQHLVICSKAQDGGL